MKVLFLTDSYRPSRSACANRAVVLVEALRARGVDVQVLASSDSLLSAPAGYEAPSHVAFFQTFPLREKTLVNRLRNNFGGQRESVRAAKALGAFDVVVCTTPPLLLTTSAMKIARRLHAKLVLDVRDIWPDVAYEMGTFTPGSLYGRFFTRIARKGFARADMVTTVSPGKLRKLASRVRDGEERLVLVPNGIDDAFLDQGLDSAIIERFDLDGKRPICSYVGNIGLAQGLDTLIDIAKTRPGVRFLLFGDGAERVRLERRVEDENIGNVAFCGSVDGRGVYTVLSKSTFAYVPLVSSKLADSIPTKLYECLACGCPILLAAAGDAAELAEQSGLGRCVAPEDAAGIARTFDEMLARGYSMEQRAAARRFVTECHRRQAFAHVFADEVCRRFGERDSAR